MEYFQLGDCYLEFSFLNQDAVAGSKSAKMGKTGEESQPQKASHEEETDTSVLEASSQESQGEDIQEPELLDHSGENDVEHESFRSLHLVSTNFAVVSFRD